jgi:hypothetical protein
MLHAGSAPDDDLHDVRDLHGRLTDLLSGVLVARGRLERAREDRRVPEQQVLRQELLLALEQYAEAISDSGAPLPYRLRTEINLYRGLRGRG